jgi:hypothetical protein
MTNRSPNAAPRPGRRIWPRRNVLMRRVDWVEAALRLVVATAAIVLIPVALTLGSETYAGQLHSSEEQSRARQQVTATLVQDAPGAPMALGGESATTRSTVRVRWRQSDGVERTGMVPVPDGLHSGANLPIWLDAAGNPVAEPISSDRAAAGAIAVAVGSWTIGVGLLVVIMVVTHVVLNRRRAQEWGRAWARVEPDWSRRPT